jgi:hypothetical protein
MHKHREENAMPKVGFLVDLKKTPESSNNRIAHERNERRADEPKVMRRQDLPRDHRHQGAQHGVSPLIEKELGDVGRIPPDRPWMVGN